MLFDQFAQHHSFNPLLENWNNPKISKAISEEKVRFLKINDILLSFINY